MPKSPNKHDQYNQDKSAWRGLRADMDKDVSRGLMIINGGAAVSLLAFLQSIAKESSLHGISPYILSALLTFSIGLFLAVLHTHFRRRCTELSYGFSGGMELLIQTPCLIAVASMIGSFILFLVGVIIVFTGGMLHLVP